MILWQGFSLESSSIGAKKRVHESKSCSLNRLEGNGGVRVISQEENHMNKSRLTALAILAASTGPVASADASPDAVFAHFGTWGGPCVARGLQATCTSIWRPGLSANHVVQDYSIVSGSDGATVFAGRGLYRFTEGKVDGVWEDSRGAILDLSGRYDRTSLTVIWVDPQTEIGRSEYTWSGEGLNATDSVLTDTGWRDFMTVAYSAREPR